MKFVSQPRAEFSEIPELLPQPTPASLERQLDGLVKMVAALDSRVWIFQSC
jgi:hypothetical protein